MPPFCAPKCPARNIVIKRWHRTCFRCPMRYILSHKKQTKNYSFDTFMWRYLPHNLSIDTAYLRNGTTFILYNNQNKFLSKQRDILLKPVLSLMEKQNNKKLIKLFAQICEELSK
jgi:hypothetical protein